MFFPRSTIFTFDTTVHDSDSHYKSWYYINEAIKEFERTHPTEAHRTLWFDQHIFVMLQELKTVIKWESTKEIIEDMFDTYYNPINTGLYCPLYANLLAIFRDLKCAIKAI
ncbi:hypothetical protein TetV_144 [Tetraselmis virus 1]|uniref:Uncharacterized protein n=1 Tax=Tetraselmis virus 1 TaxID=2060617 RepID=A0A2P0VMW3_9VIRU|nr:hypothetical protein QJ968_gp144 [Tetraselmis virus 1]AUF82236.1 hypothetical protein TetV_144 [Tetraselmis virus 1]